MNFQKVPLSKIQLWDKNPRNIKTKDFERLKKQITELGPYKPLIAYPENGGFIVIGGNMRLRAMRELGFKEAYLSIVNPKTEAEKIKIALSDNDRAGEYDEQQLAELAYPFIEEINLEDYKVDLGEAVDLQSVIEDFGPNVDGEEDEVPEMDDTPAITQLGDLFTLGKHRLLCGDTTQEESWVRLMGGNKADMIFTDPPYNCDYGSSKKPRHKIRSIEGDKQTKEEWQVFNDAWIALLKQHYLGGDIYVWGASGPDGMRQRLSLIDNGFHWSATIVWKKQQLVLSPAKYQRMYEPCFYGWMGRSSYRGDRKQTEVWEVNRPLNSKEHPTMKPVKLALRAIKNSCPSGGIVWDGFLGSGTTVIAAEKLSRTCYGMEIDPKYCDVIITRYCNYTETSEDKIREMVERNV